MHDADTLPWYKQFWPWFIIALPATMVIACFYLIALSIINADELVSDDYYKDGLAINQLLQKDLLARQLDARATVILSEDHTEIKVDLQGSFTNSPVHLTVEFEHPTASSQDIHLSLKLSEDEYYRGLLDNPIRGRWYLSLMGTDANGKVFRLTGLLDTNIAFSTVLVPNA